MVAQAERCRAKSSSAALQTWTALLIRSGERWMRLRSMVGESAKRPEIRGDAGRIDQRDTEQGARAHASSQGPQCAGLGQGFLECGRPVVVLAVVVLAVVVLVLASLVAAAVVALA